MGSALISVFSPGGLSVSMQLLHLLSFTSPFFSVSLKSIQRLSLVSFTGGFESASLVSCGHYFKRGTL